MQLIQACNLFESKGLGVTDQKKLAGPTFAVYFELLCIFKHCRNFGVTASM
jgi:hypothetical protein